MQSKELAYSDHGRSVANWSPKTTKNDRRDQPSPSPTSRHYGEQESASAGKLPIVRYLNFSLSSRAGAEEEGVEVLRFPRLPVATHPLVDGEVRIDSVDGASRADDRDDHPVKVPLVRLHQAVNDSATTTLGRKQIAPLPLLELDCHVRKIGRDEIRVATRREKYFLELAPTAKPPRPALRKLITILQDQWLGLADRMAHIIRVHQPIWISRSRQQRSCDFDIDLTAVMGILVGRQIEPPKVVGARQYLDNKALDRNSGGPLKRFEDRSFPPTAVHWDIYFVVRNQFLDFAPAGFIVKPHSPQVPACIFTFQPDGPNCPNRNLVGRPRFNASSWVISAGKHAALKISLPRKAVFGLQIHQDMAIAWRHVATFNRRINFAGVDHVIDRGRAKERGRPVLGVHEVHAQIVVAINRNFVSADRRRDLHALQRPVIVKSCSLSRAEVHPNPLEIAQGQIGNIRRDGDRF